MKIKHTYINLASLLFLTFCYLQFIDIPFTSNDSVVYAIIGKGILEHGYLPYSYVFDHKPIFTYYIYAAFSFVYRFEYGYFATLSFICYILIGISLSKLIRNNMSLSFVMAAVSALAIMPFVDFSANTELLYLPLSIMSIALLHNNDNRYFTKIILAGTLASAAVNTNYLAGVFLSLPTLYLLYSGLSVATLKRISLYSVGVVAGCAIIFIPYLFSSVSLINDYFTTQINFLSKYGNISVNDSYWSSVLYFSRYYLYLVPVIVLFSCAVPTGNINNNSKKLLIVATLLLLSSFLAVISPKKEFSHYFAMAMVPIVIFIAFSIKRFPYASVISLIPVILLCYNESSYIHRVAGQNTKTFNEVAKYKLHNLKSIIGNNEVLPMRSSHVPFYYSDIKPSNNIIWNGLSKVMYGSDEAGHFEAEINKKPIFIITSYDFCKNPSELYEQCKKINKEYDKIDSLEWGFGYGYDLYKLN